MNKTHVRVTPASLLFKNDDGTTGGWELDPGCKVTINGKPAALSDLQAGDVIEPSGQPATSLTATRQDTLDYAQYPSGRAGQYSQGGGSGNPYLHSSSGGFPMAKATVSLVKKSSAKKVSKGSGAKAAGTAFIILDNQDDTCTVQGVDAGGNPVDISTVASLSVTSDTPAVLSVDPPNGMTFAMHGLTPGNANVTVTATWNDGSIGPFTFVLPVACSGSAATGIVVTPGTPTSR